MKKWAILLALAIGVLMLCGLAQAETTTTVMMYMCGTDLQEDCVNDLYEMSTPDLPDSVQVVVQAGGAKEWADSDLTAGAINRFRIVDHMWEDMTVLDGDSMGDGATLTSFLDWAVDAAPADRYVLILWDHGGGSVSGVCFDETADYDSLTIHEINDVLYQYTEANPDFRLDVIGMDACLMATYELASHMRWYADYLVGSEELEPYLGWNYEGWLSALAENPDMDTQSLTVAMVDAYMEACLADNPDDYVSLSSVYLPAMDDLVQAMEAYSGYLMSALDNGQMAVLTRARQRMYAFGSFDDASTDMVDLMALLDATRQFAPETAKRVEQAYQKAVRYTAGTDKFDYLTGLSILLPGDTAADLGEDMSNYACGECIPNYSQFVEGYVTMLNGADYVFTAQTPMQLDGQTAAQLTGSGEVMSTSYVPEGTYVAQEETLPEAAEDVTSTLPEAQSTLTGSAGVFIGALTPSATQAQSGSTGGFLGSIGTSQTLEIPDSQSVYAYAMTLSGDELDNLSMVEGLLYMDASDEEDTIYIEMGAMQNAGINWDTGEIVSEFDGAWPMLDEQLVVIYDQVVTSGMRRSVIPVRRNGVDGYLLLTFTAAHPEGVITGFSQGYDDQGLPVRGSERLAQGDVVIPTYPMLYEDENGDLQESSFDGDPITVGESGTIPFEFQSLEGSETDYLYCFRLTDIYGETHLSDFTVFSL